MASGGLKWPNSGLRVAQSGLTVGVLSPKRPLKIAVAGPWLLAFEVVVRVARRIAVAVGPLSLADQLAKSRSLLGDNQRVS